MPGTKILGTDLSGMHFTQVIFLSTASNAGSTSVSLGMLEGHTWHGSALQVVDRHMYINVSFYDKRRARVILLDDGVLAEAGLRLALAVQVRVAAQRLAHVEGQERTRAARRALSWWTRFYHWAAHERRAAVGQAADIPGRVGAVLVAREAARLLVRAQAARLVVHSDRLDIREEVVQRRAPACCNTYVTLGQLPPVMRTTNRRGIGRTSGACRSATAARGTGWCRRGSWRRCL